MFFKVLRVFVLLTLGIVFASCSGLAIQVAFDLDGPVLLNDQEDMLLGASHYSIRFDEAIKKVGSPKTPITMKLSTTTTSGTNVTGISASTTESDPTQLDISFSASSLNVGDTITISIPEGYLTDEADNPNLEIEHKVTVALGAASIGSFKFFSEDNTALDDDVFAIIKGNMITATVPSGTDLNGLIATFDVSEGVTVMVGGAPQSSGVSSNDFSNGDVTYTVKEDTTTKEYTVTVSEAESSEVSITALTLDIGGTDYVIDFGAGTSAKVVLPAGTSIPDIATVTSVTLSTGASGLAQGGSVSIGNNGEASITITAEDGTTTGEYTVTVSIAKADLNALTLTYAEVTTTEGASYTSSAPTWAGGSAPTEVTYSIEKSGTNSPASDGSGTTVAIDSPTGKITITDAAVAGNSGTYTVTATASATSNYVHNSTQTTTVTVKVKGDLNSYSLSYPIANSTDGSISATPVWRKGSNVVTAPSGVSYSDTSNPLLSAIGFILDTTNGTISGNINIPSPAMPKVTAYQITATGNDTDYAGTTTGTFLDTFPLGAAYTQTTTGTAVSTVDELKAITQNLAGEYYLTNHIDLSTETSWTPIASSASPFTGKLHGNGYAIYNLTINAPSATHQGLFASVSGATIENLGIGVTSITGLAGVGALAGVAKENASLDNIAVVPMTTATKIVATGTAPIEGGLVSGALLGGLVGLQRSGSSLTGYSLVPVDGTGDKVGGLVGESNDGGTVDGFTTGAVIGTGNYVGGLVGYNNIGTVSGHATGAVSGKESTGGLVGFNDTGTVSGHAMGAVSGKEYTGGLVGQSTAGGTVSGYATGAVTGDKYVGGLVGASSGPVTGYTTGVVSGTANVVGGLVGYNDGTVSGYATGAVSGTANTTNNVGGLVGFNNGTVSGYATGAVSGKASVGGLVGYNQSGTTTVGYATGAVSADSSVGGLVGNGANSAVTGYWDKQSTNQNTSSAGGVGISATRNIVFDDTTDIYTDSNNNSTIFNNANFTTIFDMATAKSQTWPKLKSDSFTFPQPTVSGTATDGTIDVVHPPRSSTEP